MPVWMITGATGFVGREVVAEFQRSVGGAIVSLSRSQVAGPGVSNHVPINLTEVTALRAAVESVDPDVVIHAAGRTPPGDPGDFYRVNVLGTLNLLDALRGLNHPVRVVIVGSAAELGPVPTEHLPVSEDYPCHPSDAYGLSKYLATTASMAASAPLEVVCARVFNVTGPGAPTNQVIGNIASRLAVSTSVPCRLEVRDLEVRRDFVDVRDVARAISALAERGTPGTIYNVGTSRSVRVGDCLDRLLALCGRAVEVVLLTGPRQGPADSRANIHRIQSDTGWRPEVGWEQSLADLWDEVRGRFGCH